MPRPGRSRGRRRRRRSSACRPRPTADRQAASFSCGVGIAASARAARSRPVAVWSRAFSASISVSVTAFAAAASAVSSVHRMSVSTRDRRGSRCPRGGPGQVCGVVALGGQPGGGAVTSWSWASLPGPAARAQVPERRQACGRGSPPGARARCTRRRRSRAGRGGSAAASSPPRRAARRGRARRRRGPPISRVPGHVPRRGQDEGAGQGVGEAARVGQGRGQGALVEPDLGVGEVVVVDEQEVRGRPADELGRPRSLAPPTSSSMRSVRTRSVPAEVIQPDGKAVRTKRLVARGIRTARWRPRRSVPESSTSTTGRSVLTPAVSSQARLHARRSRPLVASSSSRRSPRVVFPQACVAKYGAKAGEERLPADVGDELLEDRRALGIGDAVEVHLDVAQVADRGDDGWVEDSWSWR